MNAHHIHIRFGTASADNKKEPRHRYATMVTSLLGQHCTALNLDEIWRRVCTRPALARYRRRFAVFPQWGYEERYKVLLCAVKKAIPGSPAAQQAKHGTLF